MLRAGVAAVLCLTACDGLFENQPAGPTGELSAAQFIGRFGRTFCAKAHECRASFPGGPQDFEAVFAPEVDACPQQLNLIDGGQLQASVDAGRVDFNASAALLCVDEIDALTCAAMWGNAFPPSCEAAVRGTIPFGGGCTLSVDCVTQFCGPEGTCTN